MKKFLSLLLTIISLTVVICSCSKNTTPIETETGENGEIITTTAKQTTTKSTGKETTSTIQKNTETTKKNDSTEFPEDHYVKTGGPLSVKYVETPTRVILPGVDFSYYNKLDNERYVFCFDPLCDHSTWSCVANIFYCARECVYSPYTKRIYMEREDTLFSMKFDGSDIRIEISFGDVGSDITKDPVRTGDAFGRIENLQQYDNYLYFVYPTSIKKDNSDYGYEFFWSLFRYNLKTKKLENLSENVGHISNYFYSFALTKDKIYFNDLTADRGIRLFSSNLDMTDIKEVDIENSEKIIVSNAIFDGENFYSAITEYKKEEITGTSPTAESYQIVCFDPETKIITEISEKSYVADNNAGRINIFSVTDEYIYYTIDDPFYIGTYKTRTGENSVYNSRHTLYRIRKDGSDKKVVYEGLTSKDPKVISCGLRNLYIISGEKKAIAIIITNQYSAPKMSPNGYESVDWQRSFYVSFDIDDNGNFVNMHELELDIDE